MLAVQAWRLVSMSRTRNPSGKETETGNTKTKLSNRSDPVLSQVFLKTLPYYKKAEHDQGHPKSTPDLHIHTSACISTCLHTPHTDMWKKLFHFKCNHFHDPLDSILIFITLSLSVPLFLSGVQFVMFHLGWVSHIQVLPGILYGDNLELLFPLPHLKSTEITVVLPPLLILYGARDLTQNFLCTLGKQANRAT